ncbi:basic proline-rich protein-like [Elephas maximus indicus]|uniref:basic proline-rich protein-like n=1 Tax=Elephas maximus indicus TaxID=99487 RepID=UPI002116E09E|nr:basic proline-rich protein-like [Elephas maximus indicus]
MHRAFCWRKQWTLFPGVRPPPVAQALGGPQAGPSGGSPSPRGAVARGSESRPGRPTPYLEKGCFGRFLRSLQLASRAPAPLPPPASLSPGHCRGLSLLLTVARAPPSAGPGPTQGEDKLAKAELSPGRGQDRRARGGGARAGRGIFNRGQRLQLQGRPHPEHSPVGPAPDPTRPQLSPSPPSAPSARPRFPGLRQLRADPAGRPAHRSPPACRAAVRLLAGSLPASVLAAPGVPAGRGERGLPARACCVTLGSGAGNLSEVGIPTLSTTPYAHPPGSAHVPLYPGGGGRGCEQDSRPTQDLEILSPELQ